ncbi:hypothetical protein RHSIM_Rhsim05G0213000 [Rhododendron simsii]|uniref:Ubiquitin-like protease family profile domain-containing protein n=1 Tax=Rhododendron simsii TaxID=118357 RepID=A0A834LN79_RHOSS|nr:hypothetical protein RHSIM_Rhsim05G0213000 [Rhododendron simsii]
MQSLSFWVFWNCFYVFSYSNYRICLQCPKQPTNVECGFYVMKYMKDLIRDERILSKGNFNGKKTYTKAEIDEVRAEWIKSVMNEVYSAYMFYWLLVMSLCIAPVSGDAS